MADYLIVHVITADVPSSSSTSPNSYFVMLRYNGQNHTTSVKKNNVPIWNEKICFHRRAQADDSGDLTLEAKMYNSGSLLGSVLLSDAHAARHSDNVVAIRHPILKGTTGSDLPRTNGGELILKVFLAAVDEVQDHIFDYVFATEDRHSEGNIVDQQHPPISLQSVDAVPKEISPSFEPGKMVERMLNLFVRVIKARKLPDVDANGGLDPYVEVTFGAYNKGITKCLKRNKNPEWNETFAFPFQRGREPCSSVDVVVNDKDLVRDDFVGKLCFDVTKIPERSPEDIALEPTWYPLLDHQGKKTLGHASLLVAIWIGSQADQAYRQARVSLYSPKVYETPRLWCLRVTIFEAQGIRVADGKEVVVFCKACLGDLIQKTKAVGRQMTSSGSCYAWNEDLLFAAAEPFFEGDLMVSVIAIEDPWPGEDETIIGTLTIPLASIDKRANDDDHHVMTPQRFGLKNPAVPHLLLEDGSVDDGNSKSHMHICLLNLLEGGYQIGPDDSQGYTDDTRPADRNLWGPRIGSVHLGILRAVGLTSSDGKSTPNPYCVAKYGGKWARTRTIIGPDHIFNEQYTWDIYDLATVLNVGVFDHFMQRDCGHRRIGNVRIHLSSLETDRIYAHSYPLVILSPSGATRTGELHLAVKISLATTSAAEMLRLYTQPALPRMHYVHPLTATHTEQDFFSSSLESDMEEEDKLKSQAAKILALVLGRMEQPLRSEVVASMCHSRHTEVFYSLWSQRKAKANFNRLSGLVLPFLTWFGGMRSWRNPAATLLAHAIFVLVLWFPKLVLMLVLLYGGFVAVRNYRLRPSCPPYVGYDLSLICNVQADELDEEFDTAISSRSDELVRMRYDRLRLIAGRVQVVTGDFASMGEKIQSLVSWRDPRATAIFYFFMTMVAAVVYFVLPFKVLVAVAGFYIMRHPRFRTKTPSIFSSFFRRLPNKGDDIL